MTPIHSLHFLKCTACWAASGFCKLGLFLWRGYCASARIWWLQNQLAWRAVA